MIAKDYITEWREQAPWISDAQVEQDLVISRALAEIFSIQELARSLAFRGGTALFKLYLRPPVRYSEDIDLVQIAPEPIGDNRARSLVPSNSSSENVVTSVSPLHPTRSHFEGEPEVAMFDEVFARVNFDFQPHRLWRPVFGVEAVHEVHSRSNFEKNLALKLKDPQFQADLTPLLRPGITWDIEHAARSVSEQLIARLEGLS